MKKFFGANWLTSVLGLGEKGFYSLAGFILLYPELVHALIPPSADKYWAAGLALLGFILGGTKDIHTKDKSVTGGTVPNDQPAVSVEELDRSKPGIKQLILIFLPALPIALGMVLSACSGTSGADLAATGKQAGAVFVKLETPQAVQVECQLATAAGLASTPKADQQTTAQWCSCISRGLRQFTGATVPDAAAVKLAIEQESGPVTNPTYQTLISSFCTAWGAVVPALESSHADAKTVTTYLNAAATGVDQASAPYLPAK